MSSATIFASRPADMATDQQVAITRTNRLAGPSQISRTARQVVPAFLQKLYEMVNDPKNFELIRWSDAGDSFFVLDHERFAHEVLGRWFKHRNFSSFVRQLNMYGFHKIPHLQQGVLKSDSDNEFWNFAHANFHRGQPDLLCLIQRKKQVPQPGEDISMEIRDTANPPSPSANLSSGQVLDIHSIVNGIAAIKRHQTTISAELNELKRSNQLLWQDAMAARGKHQKQQDTINRIVKFLAGVFGSHATHKDDAVESPSTHAVVPRRATRLMIEDAKRDAAGKGVVELVGDDMDMNDDLLEIPLLYPTVETPGSAASPAPSVVPSDVEPSVASESPFSSLFGVTPTSEDAQSISESLTEPSSQSAHPDAKEQKLNNVQEPSPDKMAEGPPPQSSQSPLQNPTNVQAIERSVTPTRPPPTFDYDPRVQGFLSQLSPSQIQQLLASLAAQTLDTTDVPPSSSTHLTTYQPPQFDFSSPSPPTSASYPPLLPASTDLSPAPTDGLISFDHYDPQTLLQQQRMDRQWHATSDIDKDVNALNSSINSLIQTFGLDPGLLNTHQGDDDHDSVDDPLVYTPNPSTLGAVPPLDDMHSSPDFDFDSFFNTLSTNHEHDNIDFENMASTAFLDEMPSPDTQPSPIASLRHVSPEVSSKTRKRKSDVVSELEGLLPETTMAMHDTSEVAVADTTQKVKRRKDK